MFPSKINKNGHILIKLLNNSLNLCTVFYRKKQFRYLQETKGKKPGIVNEENNDSKKLTGENTNRAMLNYTTREFYNEKLEVKLSLNFGT